MMSRLKKSAGPTSTAASISTSVRDLPGGACSSLFVGVLDHDDGGVDHGADGDGDAARLMMLELKPSSHMQISAISTPSGSVMMATSALRACSRKMTQTSATMALSSRQRPLEGVDRAVDQIRAVVDGLDADALREGSAPSRRAGPLRAG